MKNLSIISEKLQVSIQNVLRNSQRRFGIAYSCQLPLGNSKIVDLRMEYPGSYGFHNIRARSITRVGRCGEIVYVLGRF